MSYQKREQLVSRGVDGYSQSQISLAIIQHDLSLNLDPHTTIMSRSKTPQLQPFDVVEVPTPKPPKQKSKYSICGSVIHLTVSVILLLISVVWLCLIFQYGLKPWLPGPLNAWHHVEEFKVFMSFGIVWIFLLRPFLFKRL